MNYNELKLMVDSVHNLLYCDLPKAGTSEWNKIMWNLGHGKDERWTGKNVHQGWNYFYL